MSTGIRGRGYLHIAAGLEEGVREAKERKSLGKMPDAKIAAQPDPAASSLGREHVVSHIHRQSFGPSGADLFAIHNRQSC